MADHSDLHGPYPGQQSRPQSRQPFTQASASLNPPQAYYSTFQQPNMAPGNFASINNSYQYNANNIPGLGLGASLPHVSYRSKTNIAWHPSSQPAKHPAQNPPNSSPTKEKTPASSHERDNTRENAPGKQHSIPPSQRQPTYLLEEGELSEGEFDDLYEPNDSIVITAPAPPSPQAQGIVENTNGSVGDADGSSIYDAGTPQGGAITNSTSTSFPTAEREYSPGDNWEPTYPERERSGSYSPYLSPREFQRKLSVSKPNALGAKQTISPHHPMHSLPGINTSSTHQLLPTISNGATHTTVRGSITVSESTMSTKNAAAAPSFQSVSEAKKKAQEAILALWPLKVRYQHYIEEGFDEKFIKGLFTDLGLDTSLPKHLAAQKVTIDSQASTMPVSTPPKAMVEPQKPKDNPSTIALKPKEPKEPTITKSTANTTDTNAATDTKATTKTAAEERKDKIARKLAAKAQKTTPATKPSAPTPSSQPTPADVNLANSTNASPMKAKTRAENNALLHQKLAALKRSQERAAADKNVPAKNLSEGPAKPDTLSTTPTNGPSTTSIRSKEEVSVGPVVALPALNQGSGPAVKAPSKEVNIPGLAVSPHPVQSMNRNLKRPVASDFDHYPAPTGSLKRSRTQETLIIDVSDDEDVEMDIGSPTDEPNSSGEIINQPLRQASLGAFPPLSDSSNRKPRPSPGSSTVPTPPVSGAKLDLLHKRIEETKRLIAEAEAKKAVKKPSLVHSPESQQSPIQATTPLEPLDVLKPRGEIKKADTGRRDRIISYELPAIQAALVNCQEKMKQTNAQGAQLQLLLQLNKEESERMAAETERLKKELDILNAEASAAINAQAQLIPSTTAAATLRAPESSLLSEQRRSLEQNVDVTMAENDQESVSTKGQTAPVSFVSNPIANNGPPAIAVMVQSSQDVTPTEEGPRLEVTNGNLMSPSASTNVSPQNSGPYPDKTIDTTNTSQVQTEGQDLSEMDTLEPPPLEDLSLIDHEIRVPKEAPASHAEDIISVAGSENSAEEYPSYQEPNGSPFKEQSMPSAADEIHEPAHELTVSVPEISSGEVQNSSSDEHLLLTSMQNEPPKNSQLNDVLSYHSPLGYFRAYRFHPRFFDEVAGGLKSMTYSSKIDPMRPLCPRVLAGEHCPASNCEFQHFENMVLQGKF
ncbi:uncharacterized protein GGS25DRAFT_395171 [Hypoxylon fragiforme]|uniref:uncharacterized protein n=1 Tax=Hypoxylon fragiforme TaxID=63214 RepID=UPI0020C7042A|nr:uncharacterized protein GGS25DRAFT_395171 [Hypoxylon fragiforme]KAI2604707.1 hypothetical protein GGS25DRAFT_395171 [Hypoxylon fragiforme]